MLSSLEIMQCHGTIGPGASFNASNDANALCDALKADDHQKLAEIVCSCSNSQRQEICREFQRKFNKRLRNEAKSRSDFKRVIFSLLLPPAEFEASFLRKALTARPVNATMASCILCTRSNAGILAIKEAYKEASNAELEADIRKRTSGELQKLLLQLCEAKRDESTSSNGSQAQADAEMSRCCTRCCCVRGNDEFAETAIEMLCSQSIFQLRLLFHEYRRLTGDDLETALSKVFWRPFSDALRVLVGSAKNRAAFLAELFHKAMKGLGTDDNLLSYLVVARSEIDLAQVKLEFQRLYGTSLKSFIEGDTTGSYRDVLLAIVRGNVWKLDD